jgi:hypothetical protein
MDGRNIEPKTVLWAMAEISWEDQTGTPNRHPGRQIQAEMERVAAHYAERIQHNRGQVAREKETLRNWQMVKEHESQRIAEVIELCTSQPAPVPVGDPLARTSVGPGVESARTVQALPVPLTEVTTRH